MSEPETAAGRALPHRACCVTDEEIVEIEQQARATAERDVVALREALRDVDRYGDWRTDVAVFMSQGRVDEIEALIALANPAAAETDVEGRRGMELTKGVLAIHTERQRQIEVEGYDADHDRGHAEELAQAAVAYALLDGWWWKRLAFWPWHEELWKPTPDDRIRELTKAGALIAAAIDAEPLP